MIKQEEGREMSGGCWNFRWELGRAGQASLKTVGESRPEILLLNKLC